ncbi:lipocalin family protein [Flavobacterium beibuense]|uniref:lipocalin family protein n=1 Tax=Flavobacterium beibuense TaxID=657326 RepID=UPI000A5B8E9F|nr:lipocalin family protein [Flavobacterium beibuense]
MGKWKIYKAVYGQGTEPLFYDISGCGKEVLEFTNDGEVTETVYSDDDCYFGGTGTYSWWVEGNEIHYGAQNIYYHIVTVDGNELVLDATAEADYIKYYKRAE